MVIVRESGTLKIKDTIRTEKPPRCAVYYCKRKETKGLEIQVSYNNTEKISGACLGIEFHHEPDTVGESTSGCIIWEYLN